MAREHVQLFGIALPLGLANFVFASGCVIGQVGQNVSLPLFLDSISPIDTYFVLFFASSCYVVIFGVWTLLIKLLTPHHLGTVEANFKHREMVGIGICDALNGLLVVFASPGSRTAPYLQALLGNFLIPMTIGWRWIILKRSATATQCLCAALVLAGLFLSLVPTIFSIDQKPTHSAATGAARVLWPMCFMFGFMPAAIMNVLSEKSLQDDKENGLKAAERPVNLIWWLFWTSLYQLFGVAFLFWADLIPGFGNAASPHELGVSMRHGFKEFFAGHDATARGLAFVLCYVLSYISTGLLLRHAEGATWLAIVQALVSPLGTLFWTLFKENPVFKWHPEFLETTWFTLAGLVLIVPGVLIYNTTAKKIRQASIQIFEEEPLLYPHREELEAGAIQNQ